MCGKGHAEEGISSAENEKKRDEEFHKATVLSEAYKKKQEADRIAYEEKKKKSAKEVVATQKAKEATKYYEKLKNLDTIIKEKKSAIVKIKKKKYRKKNFYKKSK